MDLRQAIRLNCTQDEHDAFVSWALDRGEVPSAALRKLVADATGIEFVVSTRGRHLTPSVKAARLLAKADGPTRAAMLMQMGAP